VVPPPGNFPLGSSQFPPGSSQRKIEIRRQSARRSK
jgi:hypothetical protein